MTMNQDLDLTRIVSDEVMIKFGNLARYYTVHVMRTKEDTPIVGVYAAGLRPDDQMPEYARTQWMVDHSEFVFLGPSLECIKTRDMVWALGEKLNKDRCDCGKHSLDPNLEPSRHSTWCKIYRR